MKRVDPIICFFALIGMITVACHKDATAPDYLPPSVRITNLANNAVVSRKTETISVWASDNTAVDKVDFLIAGDLVWSDEAAPWEYRWNAGNYPEGDYELAVKAYDGAGNAAVDRLVLRVRELVVISEIKVVNLNDPQFLNDLLELEAHLFEAGTNRFLGCSGKESGLRGVERDSILYTVEAFFQKPAYGDSALTYEEVENKLVYLEIIEDDLDACPVPANRSPDDFVGRSPTFPGQVLSTPQIMSFGRVAHLKLVRARRR